MHDYHPPHGWMGGARAFPAPWHPRFWVRPGGARVPNLRGKFLPALRLSQGRRVMDY